MLAALILQVTDKCESDALKLMIYLIEGVLPDSYFADSLRGLSVDMAVFRELLRSRLPRLSKHLDTLQNAAKDGTRSYEPPLTNVFTMQWFLTLFCNCLPQPTVLRVWDLILLEGNEILLRTALAIWQVLADRILTVRSADEFYCIMGVLTRELLEFGLVDGNSLIKAVVAIGPLTELKMLRDHYLYNINPWGPSLPQAAVEKQLKLYPRQSLALDISALKKQYSKLKQRQRQAHIIFSAAISRQPTSTAPVTMNHLLLGKSALVPAKRIGPPKGTIPPARQAPSTLYWKDTPRQTSSSSSSDTELCDAESENSSNEEELTQKGQLSDNLPSDSDNILMKIDNTSVKASVNEPENDLEIETNLMEVDLEKSSTPSQNVMTEDPEISDTFDTASINVRPSSESDDENFDFEKFLADRVKYLKENSLEEDESDEKMNYSRRNSTKALQIIQENSLILHRILQCQSRLTPSPPLVSYLADSTVDFDDTSMISPSHSSLINDTIDLTSILAETEIASPDDRHELYPAVDNQETHPIQQTRSEYEVQIDKIGELKSPEYGSKYTSILEKSKSLDERYNALILNIPSIKQSVSEEKSIRKICGENSNLSTNIRGHLRPNFVSSFSVEESTGVTEKGTLELNKYKDNTEVKEGSGTASHHNNLPGNGAFGFSEEGYIKSPKEIKSPGIVDSNSIMKTHFEKFQYSYFSNEPRQDDNSSAISSDSPKVSPYLQKQRTPTSTMDLPSPIFNFDSFSIRKIESSDSTASFLDSSVSVTNFSPVRSHGSSSPGLSDYTFRESGIYSSYNDTTDISNINLSPLKSPKYPSSELSGYKSKESDVFNDSYDILNTNLSPQKSPKYTLSELGDYKSKKSGIYSFDNSVDMSNKHLQSIREENLNENSSSYKIMSPESDSKTCYNYQLSPTDKQHQTISKDSSSGNLCTDRSKENTERISPTESKYLLCSQSELKITSHGQSTKFDDIKFVEEPNRRSFTLDVGTYGEGSNCKSPLKSPMKSPSKAFNPFPVPLSSRQNKEVPLKLGLYKK